MHTTLDLLTEHHACQDGLRRFLEYHGRDYPRDRPITMKQILQSNGQADALWCLGAMEPHNEAARASRLFACDCAEHVLPIYLADHPGDNGLAPLLAIHIARLYADGDATDEDLAAAGVARDAAWAAAGAASGAAGDAAGAAWDAAWAAAGVAGDAAGAAWDAAWDAAWAAAGVARDAERQWQSARLLHHFPGRE